MKMHLGNIHSSILTFVFRFVVMTDSMLERFSIVGFLFHVGQRFLGGSPMEPLVDHASMGWISRRLRGG